MIRQTIAAAVLVGFLGSGCSFQPVYETPASGSETMNLAFDMAEPNSRLEQIIYQELSLRFAASDQPNAADLKVVVSSSEREASLSEAPSTRRGGAAVGTAETMEVTVTASAIVNRQGEEPLTITRFATALYDSISPNSVLATSVAQEKAQEDAAKAVAESLRLALLTEAATTGM